MKPHLANNHLCTGCLACVDACAQKALSRFVAEDGHVYVKCDEDKCVGCHRCEKICPVVNGDEYASNNLKDSQAYVAYCTEETLYERSTSGGLFAALAKHFIANGGYVCGVVLENNAARHIVTCDAADIPRMQGSKYMQSNTEGLFRQIAQLLKDGKKVLFCGMGCQAAAVCSFFRNNRNRDNLYVVDMICGGVPSSLLVKKFMENEPEYVSLAGFRNKGEYVLSCYDREGKLVYLRNKKTLPLMGFFGLTKRYSCGDCRFAGVERLSDMTIGDYWGSKSERQESVAIAHTDEGKRLLKELDNVKSYPTDWQFLNHNYRCVIGKTYNNHRLQRRLLPWLFSHLSYRSLCGLFGCTFKNPFWLTVHIYIKVVSEIQRSFIQRRKKSIVNKLQIAYKKKTSSMYKYDGIGGGKNLVKYSRLVVYFRILTAKMAEAWIAAKHLATAGLLHDAKRMHTELFIRTHALEKGMSIGNARYGFGKPKALSLIADLQRYIDLGGDRRFAEESCSVLTRYIEYNEQGGVDMTDIAGPLKALMDANGLHDSGQGGIYWLQKDENRRQAGMPFDVFSQSRFSVRDFGTEPINKEDIAKALKLCERTPTACNRQSQRVHVFLDREKAQKLLSMQRGCNGFYPDMQGVILLSTDLGSYSFQEINQMYVDGGLYAMNLMYALHYYGIANIPLTMALKAITLKKIKQTMHLPEAEQPVLLIGIGSYKDRWKVAQSNRKDWREYTKWDE